MTNPAGYRVTWHTVWNLRHYYAFIK